MKKIFLVLLVLTIFVPAHKVLAHEIAIDGSVQVLFHSDPDDNPSAGQPTALHFEATDSTNAFKAGDCNCVLTVSQKNQLLFESNVTPITASTSIYTFASAFTFPRTGDYKVTLAGISKTGAFKSFTVAYNFTVPDPNANKKLLISIGFGMLLILAGAFWNFRKQSSL